MVLTVSIKGGPSLYVCEVVADARPCDRQSRMHRPGLSDALVEAKKSWCSMIGRVLSVDTNPPLRAETRRRFPPVASGRYQGQETSRMGAARFLRGRNRASC